MISFSISGSKAYFVTELGSGYSFICSDSGTCFEIIGNTLIINESIGTSSGPYWEVFPR
jgi:hypothetical protein